MIGYKSWKWRHHIRRFTYTFVNTCESLTELEIAERGRKGREGKERKGTGREREGKRREGGGGKGEREGKGGGRGGRGNRQVNKDFVYVFRSQSRCADKRSYLAPSAVG